MAVTFKKKTQQQQNYTSLPPGVGVGGEEEMQTEISFTSNERNNLHVAYFFV